MIRHVPAAESKVEHPACLQGRAAKPPKVFLVKTAAAWKTFWGQGEEPPKVDFEKDMVLVAYTTISSAGPGEMDVWVLKYRRLEDVVEVRIKERLSGAWQLSTAHSRAYEIVTLPRTDTPVKVEWNYAWGTRDERRDLEAKEWAPSQDAGRGGWPAQGGQQGGWGQYMQQPR